MSGLIGHSERNPQGSRCDFHIEIIRFLYTHIFVMRIYIVVSIKYL